MYTKEIAAKIRTELKAWKGYKFSVTMESYSGGSSITVAVMSAPLQTGAPIIAAVEA